MKPIHALPPIIALVAGMALSDAATYTGFPHAMHLLELHHDGSAASNYVCAKRAGAFGLNVSDFDSRLMKQKNCIFIAVGEFDSTGDFVGAHTWFTWIGRMRGYLHKMVIPAEDIKSSRAL